MPPRPVLPIKRPAAAAISKAPAANVEHIANDADDVPDSQNSATSLRSKSSSPQVQQAALKKRLPAADAQDKELSPKPGKKRTANYMEEEQPADFSSEMQKMLDGFSADVSKTLVAKKKRLEQMTSTTIKSSNRKVEEMYRLQQNERQKLTDEYNKQMNTIVQQFETDNDKFREQEEKLQAVYRQHQKLCQQARVVQSQRVKSMKELHEQYNKSIDEMDKNHLEQQSGIQGEFKKEMALLQKKILMDTQQQEMANMRKSLQSMLF